MCGIFGYVGDKDAQPFLLEGLKRLEYRGYQAAGIAVSGGGRLHDARSIGDVKALADLLATNGNFHGGCGIGHTRWATHGASDDVRNAHPHADPSRKIMVVHNGTLDNARDLRRELAAEGATFRSDTDTELIAHVFAKEIAATPDEPLDALERTLGRLRGSYALVIIREADPDHLLVACKDTPLAIGFGGGACFVASEDQAMLGFATRYLYLNDGEFGRVGATTLYVRTSGGVSDLIGRSKALEGDPKFADKGGHPHITLAEMLDQAAAVRRVLHGRLDLDLRDVVLPELAPHARFLREARRVVIVGCGSSYHSGLLAKQWLQSIAGIPTHVEDANDFNDCEVPLSSDTLFIAISQSGQTLDTKLAADKARKQGAFVLAISNKIDTDIPRLAHAVLYAHAGPENGIASTKAYLTQCVTLLLLAARMGVLRGARSDVIAGVVDDLRNLPELVERMLALRPRFIETAERWQHFDDYLYLGRGSSLPAAFEGALKIKEIAYVHAEGYSGGGMKHGPLALFHERFPCILLAPKDAVYEKTFTNFETVDAYRKEFPTVVFTTEGNSDFDGRAAEVVHLPDAGPYATAIAIVIPLQFLAYEVSVHRGINPDRPRRLAKVVTV